MADDLRPNERELRDRAARTLSGRSVSDALGQVRAIVGVPVDSEAVSSGAYLATIGYPFDDARNPLFVQAVFDGKFGVKRAAIGEVAAVGSDRFFHDCSTLGGNSGSPVFSLTSGAVVGPHYSGSFCGATRRWSRRLSAVSSSRLSESLTSA